MKESSNGGIIMGIIALIVGLGIGFGIAEATNDSGTSSNSSTTATANTKAADLRSNLVSMGVEHMTLTDQAIDGALDGSPNGAETGKALYKNGTDLGAAIGSVYGNDAETTFNKVWKLHLDQFVAYATADANGDSTGKTAALNTIDSGYTKPLAQYLAKANPKLDEKTLESALREHVNMTATMIDDHVSKNYSAEADELSMANKHIAGLMSVLAEGIVAQYPSKF